MTTVLGNCLVICAGLQPAMICDVLVIYFCTSMFGLGGDECCGSISQPEILRECCMA